ncbi:hypothetical protein H9P43_006087 [Blastocladiella emersonii ATCC 22665]|nr:hypothetical protein H9P43_006087 [Blastocladiella emersonii ATCC 22665]
MRRTTTTRPILALLALAVALATLSAVEARPAPAAASYGSETGVGNAFNIDFSCDKDVKSCKRIEKAVKGAAQRIASEFKFRRTVSEVDGYAYPTQRFPVIHKDDGETYLYPTAVLKQLDFAAIDQGKVKWPAYDVVARFNAQRDWWFADDKAAMRPDQRDLEATALHELLHGLGFGDDTLMSWQLDARAPILLPFYDSTPPSVQPAPEQSESTDRPFNQQVFYRLTQPTIWSRFLVVNGTSVADFVKPIRAAFGAVVAAKKITPTVTSPDNGYSPRAAFDAITADATAYKTMSRLYVLGTRPGNLEFRAGAWPPGSPADKPLTLETGLRPFVRGSSVVHTAVAANATADFIMTYKPSGLSLDKTIAKVKAPKSGIGKATKDAMHAIGYTAAGAKEFKSVAKFAEIDPRALVQGAVKGKAVRDNTVSVAASTTGTAAPVLASTAESAAPTESSSALGLGAGGVAGGISAAALVAFVARRSRKAATEAEDPEYNTLNA